MSEINQVEQIKPVETIETIENVKTLTPQQKAWRNYYQKNKATLNEYQKAYKKQQRQKNAIVRAIALISNNTLQIKI